MLVKIFGNGVSIATHCDYIAVNGVNGVNGRVPLSLESLVSVLEKCDARIPLAFVSIKRKGYINGKGWYTHGLKCFKSSDHLGECFDPDWSSGMIYSRLPKTIDGLLRGLRSLMED